MDRVRARGRVRAHLSSKPPVMYFMCSSRSCEVFRVRVRVRVRVRLRVSVRIRVMLRVRVKPMFRVYLELGFKLGPKLRLG